MNAFFLFRRVAASSNKAAKPDGFAAACLGR
jgi:hypothetical protein